MKWPIAGLLLICAPAFAQSTFTNSAMVLTNGQIAGVQLALEQAQTFGAVFSRGPTNGCMPFAQQPGEPQFFYIEAKEGYAPSWYKGVYGSGPLFRAEVWSDGLTQASPATLDMQSKTWPNASTNVEQIASAQPSFSSFSATTRRWNEATAGEAGNPTPQQVVVNGKVYQRFGKELVSTTAEVQPGESRDYGNWLIFCR
jgi:hypothetical protein